MQYGCDQSFTSAQPVAIFSARKASNRPTLSAVMVPMIILIMVPDPFLVSDKDNRL